MPRLPSESSESEPAVEKRWEVLFVPLGGLKSGRPVLVVRRAEVGACLEWGLAGVRIEMPGVRGWGWWDC